MKPGPRFLGPVYTEMRFCLYAQFFLSDRCFIHTHPAFSEGETTIYYPRVDKSESAVFAFSCGLGHLYIFFETMMSSPHVDPSQIPIHHVRTTKVCIEHARFMRMLQVVVSVAKLQRHILIWHVYYIVFSSFDWFCLDAHVP